MRSNVGHHIGCPHEFADYGVPYAGRTRRAMGQHDNNTGGRCEASGQRLRHASMTEAADNSASANIASLAARTKSSSMCSIALVMVLSSRDCTLSLSLATSTALTYAFVASTALPLACRTWSTALGADDQSSLTTSSGAFLTVSAAFNSEYFASYAASIHVNG